MTAPSAAQWLEELRARIGAPAAPARIAPDPVNLPAIRRWCEAMGERNPLYLDEGFAARSPHQGIVAPPAMLEVWTMGRFRLGAQSERGSLLGLEEMDVRGFTSVVATNLEQEYLHYLRPGDLITQTVTLEGVSDEKRTALGAGHFLSYRHEFSDQRGTLVGRMRFRILKFRPAARAAGHPRPAITLDNAFFWEGVQRCELLIRKCARCGHLHHPPGPMCPRCHALEWTTMRASGRGTIHSFVIVHEPPLPAFSYPLAVALIDLEEGVRVLANLPGISPGAVRIGLPVQIEFREIEPGYVLYAFRERQEG